MNRKIRVLIVDDSAVYRLVVRRVLDSISSCEVVGKAEDGRLALEKISEIQPDLVMLDIEMPDLNGIEVLRELRKRGSTAKVIVLSKHTASGAPVTTDALLEGALDVVCKPSFQSLAENEEYLRQELEPRIEALQNQLQQSVASLPGLTPIQSRDWSCSVVVFGSSTGGPVALRKILSEIPANFPLPILIVQHIPAAFSASLAQRLDGVCSLEVVEASQEMPLEFGHVYIAPGGVHTRLVTRENRILFEVTEDAPENNCRPAVDYTLRSAIEVFGPQVLAVILTGMGRDGLKGCDMLVQKGGRVIAQHAKDCTVYGMPKAVIEAGIASQVVTVDEMVRAIQEELKNST